MNMNTRSLLSWDNGKGSDEQEQPTPQTKVTTKHLRAIAALLAEFWNWDEGFILSINDEFGWACGGPIVMWEEGPEEWVYALPHTVTDYAKEQGLHLEAATSWALSVYSA